MTCDLKLSEFNDFDRFREELSGWDTEPLQLSAGQLRLRLGQLSLGNVHVARLRLNRLIADRMAIDPEFLMYVVCFSPKVFCGLSVPAGSLIVFGPGREYRSVLSQGWESFEVVVSRQVAERAGLPLANASERGLAPENSVIQLKGELAVRFQTWARELLDPLSLQLPSHGHQLWRQAARERTIRLLAAASENGGFRLVGRSDPKPVAFYELALAALDYIDQHPQEQLSVHDIGQRLGVSERALQYAFKSAVGVSPSRYILARRLHNARQQLRDTNQSSVNVTSVAFDHDFNHLSRFAEHYRRLFGESPSQTLRSARI